MHTKNLELERASKFIALNEDGKTLQIYKSSLKDIECTFMFTRLEQRVQRGEFTREEWTDELIKHLRSKHEELNGTDTSLPDSSADREQPTH